jgi:hypothetical protein
MGTTSSAFGSTGSTSGGFGSTTGTSGGFGTTSAGATGGTGIQTQGMVGTTNRAGSTGNRFLGSNQTGTQGQTGGANRTGTNQQGLGATGQAGRGQTGRNRNGQQNQANMQGQQNQFGARGRAGNAKSVLRPQQRVAFEYDVPTAVDTQAVLNSRFSGSTGSPAALQGVAVAVNDAGVVTLRGTVESEDARKLAAILARLEPGVKSVQDELVVQPKAKESR